MKCFLLFTASVLALAATAQAATFDDLTLGTESYWYGTDDTYDNGEGQYNTFQSDGATFNNYHTHYYSDYFASEMHSWESWAYSNLSDITTVGSSNEFTAMGSGVTGQNGTEGSANYSVAYSGYYSVPTATFDSPVQVSGAYFTNNAYAYGSMLNGDAYAKMFGGQTGDDNDWFLLTITGKDVTGEVTDTVEFYLADFTFGDNGQDYIINDWTFVDLTSLGSNVQSLEFSLTSSDTGTYGMNTPAYFAMDNLTVVPEPSTFVLLAVGLLAVLAWRRGK